MSEEARKATAPKAFISYSWDDSPHQDWVKSLAARLRHDGVDVTLDQWSLAPGDQLPQFMETAVRDNDFILIICTPRYKQKSDSRQGGVGYEGDIMTAEVLNGQDHRKFIPILREGQWKDAAPSWLAGSFYINLRDAAYSESMYDVLLSNLHGTRDSAPPVGTPPHSRKSPQYPVPRPTARASQPSLPIAESGPIRITTIILSEIGTPKWDGTQGSSLYTVPFQFSREPSPDWARHFIETWNHPPSYSTMHRPHIARIVGDRLILEGTTVEEIEKYHQQTLKCVLEKVNNDIAEFEAKQRRAEDRRSQQLREHRESVEAAAKRIRFD
jgi:TIR domain